MKYLVTGGSGFIGANLVRALLEQEQAQVYLIVRPATDLWRLADVMSRIRRLCYIDLADREAVFSLVEKIKPDFVYHLAAYGGFGYQSETDLILKVNFQATVNLLDAALANGVSQFINTGSSSEYGIKDRSMHEADLCEPLSFYGLTKLAATNYCVMIGRTCNYRVCTLRLFSPYGPFEAVSRLYPVIVNALGKGEAPRLANPDSVRDFIAVERVVEVYMEIIHCNYKPGEIINVGSGKQMRVRDFYQLISAKLGIQIEPVWRTVPSREFEPRHWEADITRLKTLLPLLHWDE